MQVRILHTRSPRIPGEGSSALGQSEANVKAKAKADAKQANIPVPSRSNSDGVTELDSPIFRMDERASEAARRQANPAQEEIQWQSVKR